MVIGYTLNGEKVVIGHALTQQDNDALTEHLRQTFIRIMTSHLGDVPGRLGHSIVGSDSGWCFGSVLVHAIQGKKSTKG